jgi:glycosyltransferase involved in cell wall biosynthesis
MGYMSTLAVLAFAALARTGLLFLEIALALPLLYLVLLSIGAIVATIRGRRLSASSVVLPTADPPKSRFAILIPAHDEEVMIGTTLASLAQVDYPPDLYTVHVIADNCTDRTAEIAGAAQVRVHERIDTVNLGKGYALAWALGRLTVDPSQYDAVIVIDADTIANSQLLQAFARGLAGGSKALQAHYAVLNAADSASAALRWLALSLVNYIRPLGRNAWGGSSTLTGNGMCLSWEILARHPWQAFGLSEDYQYYLTLVASGDRVMFVPDAKVYSPMPTTVRQLQSQDIRWEASSRDSSSGQRRLAWNLLEGGIRQRDWVRLDALAELLTPPLSVLASGTVLLLAGAIILGGPTQILLATVVAGALLSYVGSAFVLLRPPLAVYRALVHAPAYICRKLWIYFVLRHLPRYTSTWVRTARTAAASASEEGMPLMPN